MFVTIISYKFSNDFCVCVMSLHNISYVCVHWFIKLLMEWKMFIIISLWSVATYASITANTLFRLSRQVMGKPLVVHEQGGILAPAGHGGNYKLCMGLSFLRSRNLVCT